MKKIISVILLVILSFMLIKVDYWKQYTDEVVYDLKENDEIKNIDISLENVNLNVITTPNSRIKLERETTKAGSEIVQYTSNYNDGDLIISKFTKKERKKNTYNDELYLEIPSGFHIKEVNLSLDNSTFSINNINTDTLNIDSKGTSKVQISNSEIKNADIKGDVLNMYNSSNLIKKEINYDIKSGSIENVNTIGIEENIKNKKSLSYINKTSFFENTRFLGKNVDLEFLLSQNKNYYFQNVNNPLQENFLKREGKSYKYNGDKSVEKYNISVNGNNIKSMKLDNTKIEEVE